MEERSRGAGGQGGGNGESVQPFREVNLLKGSMDVVGTGGEGGIRETGGHGRRSVLEEMGKIQRMSDGVGH